jgi:hypothetical protein
MLGLRLAPIALLAFNISVARADDACQTLSVTPDAKLTVGKELPKGTAQIWVVLPAGIAHPEWEVKGATTTMKGSTVTALHAEYTALSESDRAKLRLDIRDAANNSLGVRCPDFGDAPSAAPGAASPALSATAPAKPATGKSVADAAAAAAAAAKSAASNGDGGGGNQIPPMQAADCERLANADQEKRQSHDKYIVFNTLGQLCFASTPIAQGDLLRVSIAVRMGEDIMKSPQTNFQACSLRSATPNIYGDLSKVPKIAFQGAGTYDSDQLVLLTVRRCFDDQLTVTVQTSADGNAGPSTQVQQYRRYQAGVYVGVVSTDLRDGDFGLRSSGSSNIIYNKNPRNRGPAYNASVVIYGVPRYFQNGLSYLGRDLVNENQLLDRIGLVLAAGLQDPGKRFGLGLAYELIRGVNLQVLYEWVNTKQLAAYKLGDAFTGTADQIPTHNEWDHTTTVGISLDISYVTQLFSRN